MLQENRARRSPMQIVGLVVIFILAVLIILTFVIFGMFKDSGTAPKIFGYRVYVVDNDRMVPRIPEGAAVFVEEGTLPDPSKQSVILCRIDDQLWVIGFVGTQTTETGEVSYLVKYDNATDDKTWGISESDIIGVAKTQDRFVGAVITFASSKAGIMTIVIIPCLLLIAYEVVMLIIGSRASSKRSSSSRSSGRSSQSSSSHSSHASERHTPRVSPVHSAEAVIKRIGGGPDPEDLPPEREDVHIPVDAAKEEKYVEKQLLKANDRLVTTVREETGTISTDEMSFESLRFKPEPTVKRTDILREGAHAMSSLKDEAEKIASGAPSESAGDPEKALEASFRRVSQEISPEPKFDFSFGEPEAKPEPKPEPEPAPVPEPQPEKEPVFDFGEPAAQAASPAPNPNPLADLSAERIDELIKMLEEEKRRLGEK